MRHEIKNPTDSAGLEILRLSQWLRCLLLLLPLSPLLEATFTRDGDQASP